MLTKELIFCNFNRLAKEKISHLIDIQFNKKGILFKIVLFDNILIDSFAKHCKKK